MNTTKWIWVGIGMLIVMVLGYVLSRGGKPYSVLLLTIHKLIPVAVVIILVIALARANKEAALSSIMWIAVILSGIFMLGTVATGGLISGKGEMPKFVYTLHSILPYTTLLSTGATVFLLLRG